MENSIKFLRRIKAKYDLLGHLQDEYKVPDEIIAGAKAKLGADLADALSGELGQSLLEQIEATIDRLKASPIQRGEQIAWQCEGERRTDTVTWVNAEMVAVEGYQMKLGDVTPAALEEFEALRVVCRTVLGKDEQDAYHAAIKKLANNP